MPSSEPCCPLCASALAERLFSKEGIDYCACPNCGFRFSTPERNANLVNAIDDYEDAYLQYLEPDNSDDVNFDALRRWMERTVPLAGRTLLDVGAGSGKLVRYLRCHGIDASGLEPSQPLFSRFLAGDLVFQCGTIDTVAADQRAFDVVTAFDVIEHVADPLTFLRGIASVLAPGGVLFLSTPDVQSLPARLFGRRWHFYYRYHLSYFGAQTLARAAAGQGFCVVDCRHRGRQRSIGYMIRYAAEFIGGARAPRWAGRFDGWYVPTNLFDTMFVALRRNAT